MASAAPTIMVTFNASSVDLHVAPAGAPAGAPISAKTRCLRLPRDAKLGDQDANVRVVRAMAEGPNLLVALRRLAASADVNLNDYPGDEEVAALRGARAAIAKAEGK